MSNCDAKLSIQHIQHKNTFQPNILSLYVLNIITQRNPAPSPSWGVNDKTLI